jgi:hypothetical protein
MAGLTEKWEALRSFINQRGGTITSPPGKIVRIEVPRGSSLPAELTAMGYVVVERGSTMRVVGAAPVSRQVERDSGAPSAFTEVDVLEIQLGGR